MWILVWLAGGVGAAVVVAAGMAGVIAAAAGDLEELWEVLGGER